MRFLRDRFILHPSVDTSARWAVAALFPAALLAWIPAETAQARPDGPRLFCQTYDDSGTCSGGVPSCMTCHVAPPDPINVPAPEVHLNPYGLDVLANLTGPFSETVGSAIDAIGSKDSDGDGVSNFEEVVSGTQPGNVRSFIKILTAPEGEANPAFAVGTWDAAFAYRRASVLYCGKSPTFDELEAVRSSTDGRALVHTKLDTCLQSAYWLGEGLAHLADKRIRPLQAVNIDGIVPLADYGWDYRLFVHTLSGDRDARDLLLADYHIDAAGNVVTGVVPAPEGQDIGGQPLAVEQRAGMITTQWFLMIHTMFTELPRTTAAQAYRAYLGHDIAKSEGLLPVHNEPIDIDNRGVAAPSCASCHSTLDPLSYAFAYYEGINGDQTGTFNANRIPWQETDITANLLDVDLAAISQRGVRSWAEVAVESPDFRVNLARMFLTHALGNTLPDNALPELPALADSVVVDNYRAEALIHHIVDLDVFGAP